MTRAMYSCESRAESSNSVLKKVYLGLTYFTVYGRIWYRKYVLYTESSHIRGRLPQEVYGMGMSPY